jgi:Tfp pilus assembly protein PilX
MKLIRLLKDIKGGLVMKNEKGYALVLVLLIITITFVFALSMSGMALSARKQFNKSDEVNKATDLAEMGVAHYEAVLTQIVKLSNIEAKKKVADAFEEASKKSGIIIPDYDEIFYAALVNGVSSNNYLEMTVEGSNSYVVSSPSVTKMSDDDISISFETKGITASEKKILDSTILVEKNGGESLVGESIPTKDQFLDYVDYSIDLKGNGTDKDEYFPNSTYFSKDIKIRGNRIIAVHGNAFFNDQVTFNGGADIIVFGDAIFRYEFNKPNNAYTFCVTGNTYLIKNKTLLPYTSFPGTTGASCPKSNDNPWSIDPENGIEVEY